MKRTILSLIFSIITLTGFASHYKCDVCIYGESASGCVAAIQAARMGKSVIMVSRNEHVGGLTTSGLTATDINRHAAIGGIAIEFYEKLYQYYMQPSAWHNQTREQFMESTLKRTFSGKNDSRKIQWVYESAVAEKILRAMLGEAGVQVLYNVQLSEERPVCKKGTKIVYVTLTDKSSIKASMFIDCSYTGDLMAASGVSYTVGRESREQYGESLAGYGVCYDNPICGDMSPIDPETGKPWPYVDPEPQCAEGAADSRVQSYCYRVTLTDDPANQIPITKPEAYDAKLYEVTLGIILNNPGIELKKIITFTPMPNRKTDTNHLDFFNAAHEYPEASYARRLEIEQLHRDYAQGMLWFLGHDARVPEYLRNEMLRWGYAADEFKDSGNFPYHMYVREARRMVGEHVMVQQNVVRDAREVAPQSIGLGTYALDCHFVSTVTDKGRIYREGTLHMKMPVSPYPIAYGSITPKKNECTNLLVTVCLSASHVAYGSIRMEPQYMVLGQSAATAACLSMDAKCAVQDLDYTVLEKKLIEDKQILNK